MRERTGCDSRHVEEGSNAILLERMMLLTEDDIKEAKIGHAAILVDGLPQVRDGDRAVAKAQLKKVVDYLLDYGEERTLEVYWQGEPLYMV